jgi:hypothetical protein
MRRLAVGIVALASAGLLVLACSAPPDDAGADGVTGDDQNLEELPCAPLATLRCRPGYTSISLLNCPSGEGRCTAGGGCALASTQRCVAGYAPTSNHCKSKNAVRCAPVDAGLDAAKDAHRD